MSRYHFSYCWECASLCKMHSLNLLCLIVGIMNDSEHGDSTRQIAHEVKTLATTLDFDPWNAHGRRRKWTPESCSLIVTYILWYTYLYPHTDTHTDAHVCTQSTHTHTHWINAKQASTVVLSTDRIYTSRSNRHWLNTCCPSHCATCYGYKADSSTLGADITDMIIKGGLTYWGR